jgi:hypothetical protein
MKCRGAITPRSGREVWALVLVGLLAWLGMALAFAGLADLSDARAAALGGAGALMILCGGLAWARCFRPR